MLSTLKAEFRKLLTIRSTYVTSLLGLLFIVLISFYVMGYSQSGGTASPTSISSLVFFVTSIAASLSAVVALLQVIHEYRYNTLTYSLTITNSRSKFLISKIVVAVTYAMGLFILALLVGLGSYKLGLALSGTELPAQSTGILANAWRNVFYILGFTLAGLLFGILFRNIVAALLMLFVVPNTVEPLLGLVLGENVKYLPFTALQRVSLTDQMLPEGPGQLSPATAAIVFSVYLVVAWVVAWFLFTRRDAS